MDIDLTYLPINDRNFALNEIRNKLLVIAKNIKRMIKGARVIPRRIHGANILKGLIIDHEGVIVKIDQIWFSEDLCIRLK